MSKIFGHKKKGNIALESFTVIIVILSMAILSVISYMVFDAINGDLQSDLTLDVGARDTSQDLYDQHSTLFDNIILMAFVLLVVFVLISAFIVDSHPVFFIVSVVMLIGCFVAAGLLANVYDDLMTDDGLSSYANEFTYASWLMRHLLVLIVVVAFLVSIVLFVKFKT